MIELKDLTSVVEDELAVAQPELGRSLREILLAP